jgi:hypothetical protein
MRNEITDLLIDELDRYGLKGQVDDRSKHLEVVWVGSQGRRFLVVPKTPSDWRSGLNCRSDMRKILRADNEKIKEEDPLSFKKAMSLPKEPIVTFAARERALQKDVETLCELVLELVEKTTIQQSQLSSILEKMNSIQVVSTVESTVSFTGQQVVEQPHAERPTAQRHGRSALTIAAVLEAMPFEWTRVPVLIGHTGFGKATVYKALNILFEQGLVEHGPHATWRKKAHDNILVFGP